MTAESRPSTHGRFAVFAVLSFVLGCVSLVDLVAAKTFVPIFDAPAFRDSVDTIATGLGILNLCAIVLIAATVVFGHLGLIQTRTGFPGRTAAIAGTVLGYALLLLYLDRIVVSLIAVITFPHYASFVQNNFYWA